MIEFDLGVLVLFLLFVCLAFMFTGLFLYFHSFHSDIGQDMMATTTIEIILIPVLRH